MNEKKKNRLQLRRRLIAAEYVILRRKGWPEGTAWRMAKEKCDKVCKETKE